MSVNNAAFYPNVSRIPNTNPGAGSPQKGGRSESGEFEKLLDKSVGGQSALDKQPIKFSSHAMQRVKDRNIDLSGDLMAKIGSAMDKAEQKGVIDGLILTDDAAWIVSVKNRTVVTALDRDALSGNVFTNIDGAIIV